MIELFLVRRALQISIIFFVQYNFSSNYLNQLRQFNPNIYIFVYFYSLKCIIIKNMLFVFNYEFLSKLWCDPWFKYVLIYKKKYFLHNATKREFIAYHLEKLRWCHLFDKYTVFFFRHKYGRINRCKCFGILS